MSRIKLVDRCLSLILHIQAERNEILDMISLEL